MSPRGHRRSHHESTQRVDPNPTRREGELRPGDFGHPRNSSEAVTQGAQALNGMGDPRFMPGGQYGDVARGYERKSMDRGLFNRHVKGLGEEGRNMDPRVVGRAMDTTFGQQIEGSLADAAMAETVGHSIHSGVMGMAMKGIQAVSVYMSSRDAGRGVIGSVMASVDTLKGVGEASNRASLSFLNNGRDSVIDGVHHLDRQGQLGMLSADTYMNMGKLNNGTMRDRMGFDPTERAESMRRGEAVPDSVLGSRAGQDQNKGWALPQTGGPVSLDHFGGGVPARGRRLEQGEGVKLPTSSLGVSEPKQRDSRQIEAPQAEKNAPYHGPSM